MRLFNRPDAIGRRGIISIAVIAACFPPVAHAATGVRALDAQATIAKSPERDLLIAIARAGNRLVASGEHGLIIYSDDNGKSWHQGQVPVDVTLTALAFADAMHGWAAGHYGVILHTADGGATWQMQLNGLQVNQLTLAAAQQAVADNDPSIGTPRAILRANHFLQGGPENPFLAILAVDSESATVFGSYRMVMHTADGGKTWQDLSLNVGDALSHNLYDAAFVNNDIYVVGEAGSVFRSTDGGKTFPAVTSPSETTMFEVLPSGDGGVFTCGVAGQAFRSADNGATWQQVDVPTQSSLTAAVVLASGAIIIGNEAGTLYISHDHAKTFTALPEFQPMEIFGLAQAANLDVVAIGNAGIIVVPAADFN